MINRLRLFIIVIAGLLLHLPAAAQVETQYALSDLKQLLAQSQTSQAQVNYNVRIARFYILNKLRNKTNVDSAIFYAQAAYNIGLKSHSAADQVLAEEGLTSIYVRTKQAGLITKMLRENSFKFPANVQLILGGFYLFKPGENKTDLDSAAYLFNETIKASSKNNNFRLLQKAQLYRLNLVLEKGNVAAARAGFKTLAEACIIKKNFTGAADAYCRLGDSYQLTREEVVDKIKYYQLSAGLYHRDAQFADEMLMDKAIGDANFAIRKLDLAEQQLLAVINWYKAHHYKNLQDTYLLLSIVNRYRGNLDKAIDYALAAVQCAEVTESDRSNGYYFTAVAEIYSDMGNETQSVIWFRKTVNLMHTDNSEFMYNTIKQLSDKLIKRGSAREVLDLLNGLDQATKRTEVENEIIACIKGNCLFYDKHYAAAEKYYLEMMQWETRAKVHTYNSADSYHTIADFYIAQKRYDKAAYYLNQILQMPPDTYPLSKIKDVYFGLYQADSARSDLPAALIHYKQYKLLNDSIINQTKNKQIQELLIKYGADQKEKDNNILRKESLIQNVKLQKANLITKLTIGSIAALLIILALLYIQIKNRQRVAGVLTAHQQEITLKNNSLETLITKQEKLLDEKEWLIKEIHHRVKNNLQLITSLINSQMSYLDNDVAIKALKDTQNRMHSISLIHQKLFNSEQVAFIEIRSYIIDLMKFLCDTFHYSQRIKFEFNIPELQFDITQAMPLGLIINEAITNIIKYAYPNNEFGLVIIELKPLTGNLFEFSITDNGVGLPPAFNFRQSQSLGMILMKGLSEQIDGQLSVTANQGVRVTVVFAKVTSEESRRLHELDTQLE